MSLLPEPSINYGLVSSALLPVAGLILLTGLWASAAHSAAPRDLLRSLTRTIVIVAVIAHFDFFVNQSQDYVQKLITEQLKASPDDVAVKYLDLVSDKKNQSDNESIWKKLFKPGVSLFEAFVAGVLFVYSLLAGALLFLAYAAQKLCLQTAFAAAPLFLGFLGLQSTRSIGVKYILGVAGIVLWPLGWAIASMFTDSLLGFAASGGVLADKLPGASLAYEFRNYVTSFIVGSWVIGSTVAAPFVIQRAITSGTQIAPDLARTTFNVLRP